jgi:N-methylhydantoinase A
MTLTNPSQAKRTALAVDIGGTFTDAVLEAGGRRFTAKVLTTVNPEDGFMAGTLAVLEQSGIPPASVELIIHGTTLATNALIERKGAKVGLLTTDGFTDSLEIAYEHRFEQSDIFMQRPPPLVPRHLRLGVPERIAADGSVLLDLDEATLAAQVERLRAEKVDAVVIGFLHCYVNDAHERRAAELVAEMMPGVPVSLSSEVSPQIREYDRVSTTVANAYVLPLMSGYLERLRVDLSEAGLSAPLLLMMSSGGMTTVETARRFPIRLVESGPAGGAILARDIAAECGLDKVLSFDMGGTTAKICYIDDFRPQLSREFEVAREYRFLKGSGFPLRIPVIDMVEIGAGGGSIASIDAIGRISVGPESAGANPGPAAYDRGGTRPTVTDADIVMGRIDPARFAGGSVALDTAKAQAALARDVGTPLGLSGEQAASGVSQIVDETMASAASVHGVELGKDMEGRAIVAFGGAAPLHACQLAETLEIDTIVIPTGAGVGSAIGFLRADIAYEVALSRYMDLRSFEAETLNALFARMRAEAEAVVRLGTDSEDLVESRTAFMRYRGQGHEIAVPLEVRAFAGGDAALLSQAFEREYHRLFGRTIPGLAAEVMTWTLALGTRAGLPGRVADPADTGPVAPSSTRPVLDTRSGLVEEIGVVERMALRPGQTVAGPALIVEDETTTYVSARFNARIDGSGYIVLTATSPSRRGSAAPQGE